MAFHDRQSAGQYRRHVIARKARLEHLVEDRVTSRKGRLSISGRSTSLAHCSPGGGGVFGTGVGHFAVQPAGFQQFSGGGRLVGSGQGSAGQVARAVQVSGEDAQADRRQNGAEEARRSTSWQTAKAAPGLPRSSRPLGWQRDTISGRGCGIEQDTKTLGLDVSSRRAVEIPRTVEPRTDAIDGMQRGHGTDRPHLRIFHLQVYGRVGLWKGLDLLPIVQDLSHRTRRPSTFFQPLI